MGGGSEALTQVRWAERARGDRGARGGLRDREENRAVIISIHGQRRREPSNPQTPPLPPLPSYRVLAAQ